MLPPCALSLSPLPHHLIRPHRIRHRRAPDMHQPAEWEHQEHGDAEEDVQLEQETDLGNEGDRFGGIEGHDIPRPAHQVQHVMPIRVHQRHRNRDEAKNQLRVEQQQDEDVHPRAVGPHSRIGQPPLEQHGQTDEAQNTGKAARDDGENLLGSGGDTKGVEDFRRGQQANEMAEEQQQNPNVEQVAGQPHVFLIEHLAGMGLPGELIAVEARQAAEQKHRPGQIGINAKQ